MIVDPLLTPAWLILVVGLVMVVVLTSALRAAPWRKLFAASERQHVLLGGVLGLLLLWLGSIEITDGIRIHLLGVTCMTMFVGWSLTLLGGTAALIAQLFLLDVSVLGLPVAWLLTVAVPATVTHLLVRGLRSKGPQNLFVYLLGAGFGGGMLSVLATSLAALAVFALMGQSGWVGRVLDGGPLLVLMMFPEGFLNGTLVTAFTVFRPDLVKTFDEDHYLGP